MMKRTANARLNGHDDVRWAAVTTRDKFHDGHFCYSVATTGVYCRPSCPSRQAKRPNVRFHATPAEAEAAGFRPCKRCKPDSLTAEQEKLAMIVRACRTIEQAETAPSLGELAAEAGLSSYHFHRVFKAVSGVTPKTYALAHRNKRMRERLPNSMTVTEALLDAGFGSSSRFYAAAEAALGMSPQTFRAGGANTKVRYAIGTCSLGSILVATSERGVCAVLLGDKSDEVLRDLRDRFPKAELQRGDKPFEASVAKVIAYVEQPGKKFDLPLDITGTAFQHKVWRALREIPAGSTASYADIAKRIGKPKSVRAVAGACAANPVAVVIPCHRVVKSDGGLSGYRWGVERKRALLKHEAK